MSSESFRELSGVACGIRGFPADGKMLSDKITDNDYNPFTETGTGKTDKAS